MKIDNNRIVTFEHCKLIFDLSNKDQKLIHDAFENYYGSYSPYFSLIKNGVQFNSFVGVLQVGKTTIEVLPKADYNNEIVWRNILIDMLRTVWGFNVHSTGNSSLKLKSNSLLDLYIEIFITEIETLLRKGLVKKYIIREDNCNALKGSIHFAKHIPKNCIHHEKFYVRKTEYNKEHKIHQILYKAVKFLPRINFNLRLKSRISNLQLSFPEMQDIRVRESDFEQIHYDRKNNPYKTSLDIAKLILLNYHPDVTKGKNDVLALMFDMNDLWERFILVTLRKRMVNYTVSAQIPKQFWKPEFGKNSTMRPDIILKNNTTQEIAVLDTKWKNLNGYNPSPEDLRQMYVYHKFYRAKKTALLYPGIESYTTKGKYFSSIDKELLSAKECSVIQLRTNKNIQNWQSDICSEVSNFLN